MIGQGVYLQALDLSICVPVLYFLWFFSQTTYGYLHVRNTSIQSLVGCSFIACFIEVSCSYVSLAIIWCLKELALVLGPVILVSSLYLLFLPSAQLLSVTIGSLEMIVAVGLNVTYRLCIFTSFNYWKETCG